MLMILKSLYAGHGQKEKRNVVNTGNSFILIKRRVWKRNVLDRSSHIAAEFWIRKVYFYTVSISTIKNAIIKTQYAWWEVKDILEMDGTLDTLYSTIAIAIIMAHEKETEIKRYHQLLY